jgi:hypothetical protein
VKNSSTIPPLFFSEVKECQFGSWDWLVSGEKEKWNAVIIKFQRQSLLSELQILKKKISELCCRENLLSWAWEKYSWAELGKIFSEMRWGIILLSWRLFRKSLVSSANLQLWLWRQSFLFKFITFVIISVLLFDRFRLDLAQQHLLVLLRNSAGKAKAQDYALSKNKIEHAEMEKSQTRSRIRKCSVFLWLFLSGIAIGPWCT